MHTKHVILMILGCALPVAALVAVTLFQIELSSPLLLALVLLCPISHVLMMGGHTHGGHQADHHTKRETEHG